MAQRSTGMFPREKFDLDALMEVTTSAADLPLDLTAIGTVKVVVVGAAIGSGDSVTVTVGGKAVVFGPDDLDPNGVGIAYLRGSLLADSEVIYALDGATVEGVYIDAVDNVG